ncbi:MAG: SipW-dependent-type signal peptide-containing protein [Oscillospiraceae bacterium]
MKKKTLLLSLTAVIIVAALAIGGTLAYFTDNDTAENSFTVGDVSIKLYEHVVNQTSDTFGQAVWTTDNDNTTDGNTYSNIFPGAVLPKDPTIENDGSNPAYVRMKVTISNASAWKAAIPSGTDLTTIFIGFIDGEWTRSNIIDHSSNPSINTITYIYEYNYILPINTTISPLFTSIKIPTGLSNQQMADISGTDGFKMNIVAEAIQSEGFDTSAAAFTALEAKYPSV